MNIRRPNTPKTAKVRTNYVQNNDYVSTTTADGVVQITIQRPSVINKNVAVLKPQDVQMWSNKW